MTKRDDQKRRAQERLDLLLLGGLESGEPIDVTEGYKEQKRADLTKRIAGSAKHGG